MGRKKEKFEEDLDEDVLPESGLTTPDGHLFYHLAPVDLTKKQWERVKEYGMNLKAERNFSLDESVQIFKNWKKFTEEHKMKLGKAAEYIGAKKKDKLLILHQEENHFWPKLCAGLPHRTCWSIKKRAETMMTDAFLAELDWEDPAPQIADKYYQLTRLHDDMELAKSKRLLDKGYSASHVAEILDIPANRASAMATKLNRLEEREDPAMIQMVYETACCSGLDTSTIEKYLALGDEEKYLEKTLKRVKFDQVSLKTHLSVAQCKWFLKQKILMAIWKKYRQIVEGGEKNEGEAVKEAMDVVSLKPEVTIEQEWNTLEIFCQKCKKDEKMVDLRGDEKLAEILRSEGITGFQCNEPEFDRLCYLVYRLTRNADRGLFTHLRRDFRYQLKMHCSLWAFKKNDVWSKLPVKDDESRYEAVLRHELSNPFVSEMTKRFLKIKEVAQWITEPVIWKKKQHRKEHSGRMLQLSTEAFILYAHRKFKGEFKFPAKLHCLVSNASRTAGVIRTILGKVKENDNSEFLSQKEVRQVVETATDTKVAVKLRKKAFFVKRHVDWQSSEEEENEEEEEDLERIKEETRGVEERMMEEVNEEIERSLQRADPMKRKKRYRILDKEGTEEDIQLRHELLAEKRVLDRAKRRERIRTEGKTTTGRVNLKITSREFVSTSEESEEEEQDDAREDSDAPSTSEVKRESAEDSDDLESSQSSSEAPETSRKSTKHVDSDAPESSEDSQSSSEAPKPNLKSKKNLDAPEEDTSTPKFKKKSEKQKLEHQDAPDEPETPRTSRKNKENSDSENLEDVETFEHKKKSKKRKLEHQEDPEELEEPEEILEKPKKSKKKKKERLDSE